jgi:hypothetical protein
VRFGSPDFSNDLMEAAGSCGLSWDSAKAHRVFDGSCVHHVPAAIVHESQEIHESLGGGEGRSRDWKANQAVVETDALARENLLNHQLELARVYSRDLEQKISQAYSGWEQAEIRWMKARDELWPHQVRLSLSEQDLHQARSELLETQAQLDATREQLDATREQLQDTLAQFIDLRARLDRFERHPLVGPALRGGRRVRTALRSFTRRPAPSGIVSR